MRTSVGSVFRASGSDKRLVGSGLQDLMWEGGGAVLRVASAIIVRLLMERSAQMV